MGIRTYSSEITNGRNPLSLKQDECGTREKTETKKPELKKQPTSGVESIFKNDSIEDVENWIARASNNAVTFKSRGGDKSLVLVHFPKRTTLDDPRKTLEQCGFETREMLTLA